MKAVLVIRHRLLPAQEEAIKKAQIEIVETIQQIPEPTTPQFKQFVSELKAKGVEAILTVALPPHLLMAIQQAGFKLLIFKMEAVKTVESEEEAKKLVEEAPHKRVALPGALGEKKTFRVVEFKGIYEVKIVVEEKPIVTA